MVRSLSSQVVTTPFDNCTVPTSIPFGTPVSVDQTRLFPSRESRLEGGNRTRKRDKQRPPTLSWRCSRFGSLSVSEMHTSQDPGQLR